MTVKGMVKILSFFLTLFLIGSVGGLNIRSADAQEQYARMGLPFVAGSVSAAACGDMATERTDGTNIAQIGHTAGAMYWSSGFDATATGQIKSYTVWLGKTASPPGFLYGYLCPSSGGTKPASGTSTAMENCVQSTTTNVAAAGLPDTTPSAETVYSFTGYDVTSTTRYHFVLSPSAAGDANNYWRVRLNDSVASAPGGIDVCADGLTASWSSSDSTAQVNFKASSCP